MSKLTWDQSGERLYETGTDKGALYVQKNDGTYEDGVAWNGLIGVSESPSGAEETALYANNAKYASMRSAEEEEGSITAYTYPDEWGVCDGSRSVAPGLNIGQQTRRAFGLVWQTVLGNDVELDGYGKKLHVIYGATAAPSEKEYTSINDSPEAIEFSWDFKCTPVDANIEGQDLKKSAVLTVDSTKVSKKAWKLLEDAFYGTDKVGDTAATEPKLLLPNEIYAIITDPSNADTEVVSETKTSQPSGGTSSQTGSGSSSTTQTGK